MEAVAITFDGVSHNNDNNESTFDGVGVVASAQNAEIDKLFHRNVQFAQQLGQAQFFDREFFRL